MEGKDLDLKDVVFNLIVEAGHPLTTHEIANLINERGLYHPYGYECTVNTSHISNIAKEHPDILSRDLSTRPMKIYIVDFHYKPNSREVFYFSPEPSFSKSTWETLKDEIDRLPGLLIIVFVIAIVIGIFYCAFFG